jgi:hypothetical protein
MKKQLCPNNDLTESLQIAKYINEGFEVIYKPISLLKINILGFIIALVLIIPMYFLYKFIWGAPIINYVIPIEVGIIARVMIDGFIFLIILIANIIVHELIHGITLNLFCHGKWRNNIKISVLWNVLTPYCICLKPLPISHYLIGGLMPFIISGIGLSIPGFCFGLDAFTLLGFANIFFASGDIAMALIIMGIHPKIILDKSNGAGFYEFISPR